MAGPTFVASNVLVGGTNATSMTLTCPTGVVAGNVLLAFLGFVGDTSSAPAAPTGWTLYQSIGTGPWLACYHRLTDSSDVAGTTTYTWSWTTARSNSAGAILGYSGAALPPNVGGTNLNALSSVNVIAPSVTTTAANCTVVVGFCNNAFPGDGPFTPPGGVTSRASNAAILVGDFLQATAGATGTKTATSPNPNHGNVGITVALASPPLAPTITAPSGTALAGSVTVAWTDNEPGGSGLTQTAYAIKRSSDGGTTWHWYNGTDWSSAVEVFNTSTSGSVSTPSWTSQAGAWQVEVATKNTNGAGPYSAADSFFVHDPVVLSSVTPAVNAVVSTGGPTLAVGWTYSQAQALAQASYRVQVQSAGGATTYFDSGTVPSAATSLAINAVSNGIPTDTTGHALQVVLTVLDSDGVALGATVTQVFDIQWGVVTATITAPLANASVFTSSVTATWTFASTRGFTEGAYRVQLFITGTGAQVYDSGFTASSVLTLAVPYVLSDNTRYTLTVTLENTMGVMSAPVSVQFVVDMSSPGQYPVETRVGTLFSIAINGQGFMLADDPSGGEQDMRYRRVTVPLELTRFASGVSPFEEAIEHYLYAGLYSWVDGAGQTHLDRPESSATRYLLSQGVNPFTPNALSLLHTTAATVTSTHAAPPAVTAGGNLYVAGGTTSLKWTATLAGTGTSITLAANVVSLASDGQSWYAVLSDGKVYKGTTSAPGSSFSAAGSGLPASASAQLCAWAGERLCVAYINAAGNWVFSTLNGSGVEEVTNGRLIVPTGWTITAIHGGQAGHVWFSAVSGDQSAIYAWDLSTNAPALALDMPLGEPVTALMYYQQNLMVRTSFVLSGGNTGGRVYRCAVDASTGDLTPTLIVEMTDATHNNGPGAFGAFRDYVFWGWSGMDGTHVGIGCLDLSLGGYTPWLLSSVATDKPVGAIVPFLGAVAFTVGATGLFVEQLSTFVTSGTLTTSIIDKTSALQKVWEQVSILLNSPLAAGESVSLQYSLDGGTTFTALTSATLNQAGQHFVQATLSKKSNAIQFLVTLGSGGSTSPNLQLITTRVRQTGIADVEIQLPVDCRDMVRGLNGNLLPGAGPGTGAANVRALEALAQTRISFQDVDWDTTGTVYTFDVANVDVRGTQMFEADVAREESGDVVVLTLRAVSK